MPLFIFLYLAAMFCETLIMFVLYLCYVLYEAKALRLTVVSMECVSCVLGHLHLPLLTPVQIVRALGHWWDPQLVCTKSVGQNLAPPCARTTVFQPCSQAEMCHFLVSHSSPTCLLRSRSYRKI